MDFRLQVFKHDAREGNSGWTYRFAVVDSNKSKNYPSNFVCMLPVKLYQGKTNYGSVFGTLFGDKSLEFAIGLLNDALKTEEDTEIKAEIEKRLKLIDPKQANAVKCSQCKKAFQPKKIRRYKQYLCDECLNKRYSKKRY
jgi:DNA-directed RNA polymerase subunit RPC12/RpoP